MPNPSLQLLEVVANADVTSAGVGYLALTAGDVINQEYKGSKTTNDEGWNFGYCIRTSCRGWFSAMVVTELSTAEDSKPSVAGCAGLSTPSACKKDYVASVDASSIGLGYLAFTRGENITIEYMGSKATSDEGWAFGTLVATGCQGWISASAISEKPGSVNINDTCSQPQGIRLASDSCSSDNAINVGVEAVASRDVKSVGPGYMALSQGEVIKVEYVGSDENNDSGWLFGCSTTSGQQGWVSAENVSKRSTGSGLPASKKVSADVNCPPPPRRPCPIDREACPPPRRPCPNETQAAAAPGQNPASSCSSKPVEQPSPEHLVATPARSPLTPSSLACTLSVAEKAGLRLLGGCTSAVPWQYPLCDSDRRCFVGYQPGALKTGQAKAFFDLVNDSMESIGWERPVKAKKGQGHKTRRTRWFTAPGCRCAFQYKGDRLVIVQPVEFPRWMQEIMEVAMPLCGLADRSSWPNSCHLSRYSPDDGCEWHADDETLFQGTTRNCCVISLSLGGKRDFELRQTGDTRKGHIICKFELGPGDLMSMEGMTQLHYEHRVSHQGGSRLNLTWRWIVSHEGRCGAR